MSPESERLTRLAAHVAALETLNVLPDDFCGRHEDTVRKGDLCVRVVAWREGCVEPPRQKYPPALKTQCRRDVLAVLLHFGASFDRRFVGEAVYAELERRKMLHGRRTFREALARLTDAGYLVNDHDRKGYGLSVLGASAAQMCPLC